MTGLQVGLTKRRTSKLGDLLRTRGAGVGFRQEGGSKKRSIVVIASMPAGDNDGYQAAVDAGVDALEIRIAASRDFKHLSEYVKRTDIPIGVDVTETSDPEALTEQARDVGIDWMRLHLGSAVTSLGSDIPGRVLTVPSDFDLALARGIGGLTFDAVTIAPTGQKSVSFSLRDAVRIRALSDAIRLPIVLQAEASFPAAAATKADQLGIAALLIHIDGLRDITRLTSYIEALDQHVSDDR